MEIRLSTRSRVESGIAIVFDGFDQEIEERVGQSVRADCFARSKDTDDLVEARAKLNGGGTLNAAAPFCAIHEVVHTSG
jgi:hypothetical protein